MTTGEADSYHLEQYCRRRKSRCLGYEGRSDGCEACRTAKLDCTFSQRRQRASHDRIRELEMQVEAYKTALDKIGQGVKVSDTINANDQPSLQSEEMAFVEPFYQHVERQASVDNGQKSYSRLFYLGDASPFQAIPVILKATEAIKGATSESSSSILGSHPRSNGQTTIYTSALDNQGSILTHLDEESDARQTSLTSLQQRVDELWPEKEIETRLIDAFFRHSDACYPLLRRSEFEEELCKARQQQTREWLMIALTIFIIGSRCDKNVRSADQEMRWYSLVRELGMGLDWIPTPNVLQHTQASLLLTIFLWSTQLTSTVAWDMLGKTCRVMQSVGVHRAATAKKLGWSKPYADAWCRAWWVAYILDVEQACQLGRPPAISDADFDIRIDGMESRTESVMIAESFEKIVSLSRIAKDALAKLYGPSPDQRNLSDLQARLHNCSMTAHQADPDDLGYAINSFLTDAVGVFMHKKMTIARLIEATNAKRERVALSIKTNDVALQHAQKLIARTVRLLEQDLLLYGGTTICLRLVDATFVVVLGILTSKHEQRGEVDVGVLASCREASHALAAFETIMPIARRSLELVRLVQSRLALDLGVLVAASEPHDEQREECQDSFASHLDGSAWPTELFDFTSGFGDESQLWSFLQFQ